MDFDRMDLLLIRYSAFVNTGEKKCEYNKEAVPVLN
jgi:hypothetical protein